MENISIEDVTLGLIFSELEKSFKKKVKKNLGFLFFVCIFEI